MSNEDWGPPQGRAPFVVFDADASFSEACKAARNDVPELKGYRIPFTGRAQSWDEYWQEFLGHPVDEKAQTGIVGGEE